MSIVPIPILIWLYQISTFFLLCLNSIFFGRKASLYFNITYFTHPSHYAMLVYTGHEWATQLWRLQHCTGALYNLMSLACDDCSYQPRKFLFHRLVCAYSIQNGWIRASLLSYTSPVFTFQLHYYISLKLFITIIVVKSVRDFFLITLVAWIRHELQSLVSESRG